eukprot:247351-Prymnesium_polylepis.1
MVISSLGARRCPRRLQAGPRRPPCPGSIKRRYGIRADPSKRSAPGFPVSGDGGVDPGALQASASCAPTVVDGLERW